MTFSRLCALGVLVLATTTACGGEEGALQRDGVAPAPTSASAAPPTAGTASTASTAGPDETGGQQPAEEVVITISDFAFQVPVSVPPGATVTVVNEDSSFHTVTADDETFDVDAPGGGSVTFTAPEEPGEYPFHCEPHPAMTATLVVA